MPNLPTSATASDRATATTPAWDQFILSAIGDAVITTDTQGQITYMNRAAESLTGWTASEAHGRPLEEVLRLVNEHTRRPVEQPVRKVLETGSIQGLANHTLLIARDGTEVPIDDTASPVQDDAGNAVGVVMVLRDISERKKAERVVAEAKAYAESIIDTLREPLLVLSQDLRVVSANRSFYQAFGVGPEVTKGRLIYDLGNGQWDIPRLRTLLEDILPNESSFRDFEVDHDFERIGRRQMVLNGRKVRGPDGQADLILLAIEDITERWRVGVDFADNRERFRVIVEGATGYAIITFDKQGNLTSWNHGAELIKGYGEAEILGRNVRVIFTPEDVAAGVVDVEMWTAEQEGKALDERWHLRKGGERFWANGLVMPLKDGADRTRGFLKVIRDMTPEKRLEESLRDRTAALERADAYKNEFLAMLAHELRNPLAAIRNVLAVAEVSREPEDLDWGLEVIGRQVRNFSHLIEDLLDVARITQGKVQLRKEVVDAAPIVHSAVEAVKPLVEKRKHGLHLSFTSTELRLDADPTRLEQILVNLLTNAAKYTPAGGTGHIQLIAGAEGEEVVFRVRDNGIGIASELLPQMFELFAQGNRSLARSEGGLGIGLTLVKSLAELHGGTVAAFSEGPGTGSEFVVRLPSASGKSAAVASPEGGPTSQPARGRRVLIVDDHLDTATGLARFLKLRNHDVRVAHTGPDAIREARQLRPEVILLDIGLPAMDGYEVAGLLRKEEWCKGTILIAVSGYGDEQSRRKSAEAGFDQHLVKPVRPEVLLSLLQGHSSTT